MAEVMDEAELKRLRALVDAATEGPWWSQEHNDKHGEDADVMANGCCITSEMNTENARFIAAARTAVPALLDEVERLKAVALAYEDEADRVGGELQRARRDFAEQRAAAEAIARAAGALPKPYGT